MATRTKLQTDRSTTPRISIEKLDNGEYRLEVRVQTDDGEETVILSHAELLAIGTAGERTAVLSWLPKAYIAGRLKLGFA